MQFFPAVTPQGAHFPRTGGAFEMTDSRSGQGFNDLLSSHLEQPAQTAQPASTDQPQPSCGHERPFAPDRDSSEPRPDEAVAASGEIEGKANPVESGPDHGDEVQAREDHVETAKAAAPAQKDGPSASVAEERNFDSDGWSAEQTLDTFDASLADDAQAMLDGLAEVSAKRGDGSAAGGLKAKIEALHELLRQFRESDPAGRSELAATLGTRIRALKVELSAAAQAGVAPSTTTGPARRNSEQAASGALQRIEALLQRLETRRDLEKHVDTARDVKPEKGLALAGKNGVAAGETGARAKAADAAAVPQLADNAQSADVKKGSSEKEASVARKGGEGSDIAQHQAPRGKAASEAVRGQAEASSGAVGEPGGKIRSTSEAAAESLAQEDRRREPAASGAERATAKDAEQTGRGESVAARDGLAAAGSRTSVSKDGPEQATAQDVLSRKQEGEAVAPGGGRSADSEGGTKQHDARQGFFGSQEREKSSSSFRAVQSAGAEKAAPESLTQTAAQNSQTSFQQRLETPVSARSAQVYQQVENGAFKNLGQGVKQLVIRLDPADLGQVSVILQVRGKEVQAVLRSSSQEASLALNDQLGQLRTQLEAQGLKVGKLEVQTQLADSQGQSQWQGAESHNRYQENQELAMSAKRWRALERVAPDVARDVQNTPHREKLSQSGLDIFA